MKSSPASGAAEAYLLFQLAIDGARSSIYLTNPYFVPDDAMADALVRAAERGVSVSILTAGRGAGRARPPGAAGQPGALPAREPRPA